MKILPLKNRILLEPLSDDEGTLETESGIIIPDQFKKEHESRIMKVRLAGPEVVNEELKTGTQVLLAATTMMMKDEFKDDKGVNLMMVTENDVVAIIKQ